jgi:hypothetical protein
LKELPSRNADRLHSQHPTKRMKETTLKKEKDEGVDEKRITLKKSYINFEESKNLIWILDVFTEKSQRHKGQIKYLIKFLRTKHKKINWGSFSQDGKRFLKRYVNKNESFYIDA